MISITEQDKALLLKKASQDPKFKARLIKTLKEATSKTASARHTNDSAGFAMWAKLSNPVKMSEQDVIKYLVANGVSIREPGEAPEPKATGALAVGEIVIVDPHNCLSPENKRVCGVLAHDPTEKTYCIVKRVMEPADIDSRCTIEVCALDGATGAVDSKVHQFEAVTPVKGIAGIQKDFDSANKAIGKAEAIIARSDSEIESATADISALDPKDAKDQRKIDRAQKKIDKAEANKAKQIAKIESANAKIDLAKVKLRMKCLEPNDQLGLYRSGFRDLSAFQRFVENPPPPAKDFILVYNRAGRLPNPALRSQFIQHSNEARTRQTLRSGEFDDLIEGGLGAYANTYYEGNIKGGAYNKDGELYFSLAEDRGFTSINPAKGELFFIATADDMPSDNDWVADLRARLEAQAEEG